MTVLSSTPRARRAARSAKSAPMPSSLAPMLAVHSTLPADPQNYGFEFKWDGMRVVSFWDGKTLAMRSRNDLEATFKYPELHALGPALSSQSAILDGEVVALDEVDRPSFARLQRRMKVSDPRVALRLVNQVPVHYVIFDLLYLDGRSLMDLPYTRRREMLEELTLRGPSWQVTPAHVGEGAAMLETARAHSLEGIVAKRLDSIYEPGKRSPSWLKIKIALSQEFVVGGWTPQKGMESGLGALQLGYYDPAHPKLLHFAGPVGSGFSGATRNSLLKLLEERRRTKSPFSETLPNKRAVRFVKPDLVVEVEYRRWPDEGLLQQAAFKGLRFDKSAKEVVKEVRVCIAP